MTTLLKFEELYDSQINWDEGMMGEKYLIPNTTMATPLKNCMPLRPMGTRELWVKNTLYQREHPIDQNQHSNVNMWIFKCFLKLLASEEE